MAKYELTIVLDGKVSTAKKKAVIDFIEKVIAVSKGKIGRVEEWGVKDLAYLMGKSTTGLFVHFPLELETEGTKNLLTKLAANEDIIRHLLVRKGR